MNIKQEFGKWFLDVAKYVLTAMLLTSMIDGLSQTWIIVAATLVLVLCLIFGTILMRRGKEEEDRKERNRERHRNKVKNGR
jgi:Sec-independent protein secretion pathway component TatC